MIKCVLFDFDGTLMNTRTGILNSWKHLFMKKEGREITEEDISDTFGEPLKDSLARIFPDSPVEETLEIYREYGRENPEQMMKPFEGMPEVVKKLHDHGYKIGLVTSRGSVSSEKGLKDWDMLQYFDVLVTADRCERHKPDAEPALKALAALGASADEALLVGDTPFDLQCGKNAGVRTILAGWTMDVDTENLPEEYPPYRVCATADEIYDIAEGLQEK